MYQWFKQFWIRFSYSDEYHLISWLFLRGLALVYIAAFASMYVQIRGLVGAEGILPLVEKLAYIREAVGSAGIWKFPSLFWMNASDTLLTGSCLLGVFAATLILFDRFTRTNLVICFVSYLSIVNAGQDFMTFQWDMLLLEVGFLAIFLTGGSFIVVFLYRWLLFRFMLLSGVVKLASGDENWWNLTALRYHYETQPLPTPLAWYAHQFPLWVQQLSAAGVFFIELIVPFLVFLPRRSRVFAACCFIVLQSGIMLTGNYNFFNLLVLSLCLFLLDDKDVIRIINPRLSEYILRRSPSAGRIATAVSGGLATVIFISCAAIFWSMEVGKPLAQPFSSLRRVSSALGIVNAYGPFPIMTTQRDEIVIEGSHGGDVWLAYEFKYKPGDLDKPLSWNMPHQPRLDWQMWFAALRIPSMPFWLDRLLYKLQQGVPDVTELFENNPFSDQPPRYIRMSFYRYRYTAPSVRASTGQVWTREYLGSQSH